MRSGTNCGVAGGTPPADTGGGAPVVCYLCGDCQFSEASSVIVRIHTLTQQIDCSFVNTYVEETWNWYSRDTDKFRWRKDINNWVDYDCAAKKWRFATTTVLVDTSGGGACPSATDVPDLQLDTCSSGRFWRVINGTSYLLFEISLVHNDCDAGTE